MPIYVYETTSKPPRRFEIQQSMKDAPVATHPETGEPVKRVITGGYGILQKGGAQPASKHSCASGSCGCH